MHTLCNVLFLLSVMMATSVTSSEQLDQDGVPDSPTIMPLESVEEAISYEAEPELTQTNLSFAAGPVSSTNTTYSKEMSRELRGAFTTSPVYGTGSCPISVVSRSHRQLDIFIAGIDGRVYTAALGPGLPWHGWWAIGGIEVAPCAPIAAISRSTNKLDIFAIATDGFVMTAAWEPNRGGWRGWWRIGNRKTTLHAPISAVSRSTDIIDLFMADLSGSVYAAAWHAGFSSWHGWWKIGNVDVPPGAPVGALSRSTNKLDIFVVDHDGRIITAAWEGHTGWRGWWRIGNLVTVPRTPVTAVSRHNDYIDIFTTGNNGRIYSAAWQPNWTSWHGWWQVGNLVATVRSPVAAVSRSAGKLDIFAAASNGRVSTAAWQPGDTNWRGWWSLRYKWTQPGAFIGAIAPATDQLYVFVSDRHGVPYVSSWPSNGWSSWARILNLRTGMTDPRVNDWRRVGRAFSSVNTDHSEEAQGMTTDGSYWYLASNGNKEIRKYSGGTFIRSKKILHGSSHVGAPGYFEGTLYVPIQTHYSFYVWTAKQDFSGSAFHSVEKGVNRFAWCDVNPLNGRLYTTEFDHWNNRPGVLFAYDKDSFVRRPEDDIQLGQTPIHFDRIQGGVFTRHGRVILSRSDPNGIYAFSAITGTSLGGKYLGNFGSSDSEVEGVTVRPWQFGNQPAQVHVLELDNDWSSKDDCYLHSYSVPDPARL